MNYVPIVHRFWDI